MVVSLGFLNINQVFDLLKRNGASNNEAATLAGISVFEAGGGNPNRINPEALNNNASTQDYSVGLFQYNFRAGNFNASNPMQSTRGGFTPGDLLGSLDAQAQSALALLRGSASGFRNWTTYTAYLGQVQNYANQLLSGVNIGNATDTTAPVTGTGTVSGQTENQATDSPSGSSPVKTTSMNLSFGDTIGHTVTQTLLFALAIALLIGGIYLIGSKA